MRTQYIDAEWSNYKPMVAEGKLYQYDHGVRLRITGLDAESVILPQFHFTTEGGKESYSVVPVIEEGCFVAEIPDDILASGKRVIAYMYLEDEESGITVYEVQITVIRRARPLDASYTPEQQSSFDALIAELNSRIEQMRMKKLSAEDDGEGNVTMFLADEEEVTEDGGNEDADG